MYSGTKIILGVGSQSGLTCSAVVTPANVHAKDPLPRLLHDSDQRLYGDSGYGSPTALIHRKAPKARDFTNERTRCKESVDEITRRKNHDKSKNRATVEHVLAAVKTLCGFTKARYRGLAKKNVNRAFVSLALANLHPSRHRATAQVRP